MHFDHKSKGELVLIFMYTFLLNWVKLQGKMAVFHTQQAWLKQVKEDVSHNSSQNNLGQFVGVE